MNFNLPEEVYELYQWHNGRFVIGDYANPVSFMDFEWGFDDVIKYSFSQFPIFFGDGCYYTVDRVTDNLRSSPVRLYDGSISETNLISSTYAPSLTSLFNAVAECAQTHDAISIYLMDYEPEDRQNKSWLISDIYRKHEIVGQSCGLWR